MKKILSIILFLMAVTMGYAQSVIKGNVTDTNGEPLIGATVKPVGGKTGTITDIDGNYTLKSNAKQVEISYVGCKTANVSVKNGRADARLADDSNQLNEMVVIGYGSVKKGDITNAVAQIKGDELADRPVANIANALQGELAGVDVQATSGAPGSEVQIKVRGATSISEDMTSNPLYVVDGIPMDDDFNLNQLNPNDIASIDVLKDASSSAIYGSRGANGVILVTSKKGNNSNGKTTVNFSANFSISSPERYMKVMSSEDWMKWRTNSNYSKYTSSYGTQGAQWGDSYAEQIAVVGSASSSYVNDPRWNMAGYGGLNLVDWQEAMFRTGFTHNYNLSVQNGNKTSNYRASASYTDQSGIVINTGFKRLNANITGETTVKEKLKISLTVSPQYTATTGGNVDGKDNAAQQAISLVPITEADQGLYPAVEPNGRYLWAGSTASPVALMEQRYYRDEQIRINSSLKLNYEIMKNWQVEVLGSWIFNNRERKIFTPSSATRSWTSGEGYEASSTWTGNRSHKFLAQATTNYNHKWGKHSLNAVAGWSLESTQYSTTYTLGATHFTTNEIRGFNLNTATLSNAEVTYNTPDHLISYFARGEYGYDNRYLLTASVRRDGSSRFGTNRKWGTFPAVSAAWRINNEKFWKPTWVMNQAKIRVSYGSNGTNNIPVNSADGKMSTSIYSSDGTGTTGYIPSSVYLEDLGWQKTNSWNFGLDMSFFRNRISLAVDYYIKNITDMLYSQTVPAVNGFTTSYTNIGNVRTQGLEVELKTENLAGKLKWTTKASVGYSTNKVTDLGNNTAIYTGYDNSTQIIEVGHPIGEYYLYEAVGVYETEADLAKYPKESTSQVGDVRYRDINGDGIIDENDRTYCGQAQPNWTFGLTNTFKWKNWDASILITAQCGGKIWSALGRAIDMQSQGNSINRLERWQNEWFSETLTGDGMTPNAISSNAEQYSTRWLYSTDFIKLKNITLGYRFNFPKKAFVNMLRLTFSAENLFIIDKYDGGFSPESNNSGSQIKAYDYGAYPSSRTFSLGAQIQF